MEVKGKKSLNDYDYLIMFDLASKKTGVCVFDLRNKRPESTSLLEVTGKKELPVAELKDLIDTFMTSTLSRLSAAKKRILVSFEAMPVQLRGGNSTISTFVALARSHAILDDYLFENDWDTYDYVGIYPASTRAYYYKLRPEDKKLDTDIKTLVFNFVSAEYNLKDKIALDESDAVFLAKTLIDVKWNNDLAELIREKKRHKKTLKAPHAIKKIDDDIAFLQSLTVD